MIQRTPKSPTLPTDLLVRPSFQHLQHSMDNAPHAPRLVHYVPLAALQAYRRLTNVKI